MYVTLEDVQKEIEKHKKANETLLVANNYQADKIKGLESVIEAANKIFTKSLKTIIEQKMLETVSDNAVFSLHFSKADIIALKNALLIPRIDEQKQEAKAVE